MVSDDYLIGIGEGLIGLLIIVFCNIVMLAQTAVGEINRNALRSLEDAENKKANRKADKVLKLLENYKRVRITSIFVVTLGIFWILLSLGGNLIRFILSRNIQINTYIITAVVSIVGSLVVLTFVIFLPREFARQNQEKTALKWGGFLFVVCSIFYPFAFVIKGIGNLFLKMFRKNPATFEEEFSEENILSLLERGQESGALKEEGKKMINSIFAFDDKLAYEIMTPRTDVFSIDILDDTDEYIDELMEMKYSRIPVYEDDSDNIIGILNVKDYLIQAREKGFESVDIRKILRDAYFIPETKNIDSLFFELQKTKQHIAILIDEYGGFSGIVTMEDIIEEVMGDIDDEYDEDESEIEKIGKNEYLIDGNMSIDRINEEVETDLESETSETIGGFLIDILGEIPDDGADSKIEIHYENYKFNILKVKDRRIEQVKMTVFEKQKDEIEENR